MKAIEVYETEDGQRFDNEQEAISHEKECILVEWLRKKESAYEEYIKDCDFDQNKQSLNVFERCTAEDMFYFLKYNKDDLIRILSNL